MKDTKVINIYAGAGAGKTTLALELTAELKKRYNGIVEYVPEYAKSLILHGKEKELKNQEKVSAEQAKRFLDLVGKVDIIVTDSPIELGKIYVSSELQKSSVKKIIDDCASKYKSIDLFLQRDETRNYESFGRIHSLEESKKIDERILKEIDKNFIKIDNTMSVDSIINKLDLEPEKLEKSTKKLDLNAFNEHEMAEAFLNSDYQKLVKAVIEFEKYDEFQELTPKQIDKVLEKSYDRYIDCDGYLSFINEDLSEFVDEKIYAEQTKENTKKLKNIER